ncbi:MAG: hypothetical protein JWP97_1666 [Labilithrix sp.]|nr:hypothetical protein [Labilithrix sp.]
MASRRGRRMRMAFGIALGAGALGVFVACSFPDVAFAPGGEGGTDGAAQDGFVGDGGSGGDGSADLDAVPPIDGTSEKPDTGPCVDPCDCDKDGHKSREAGCGGDDCDDTDPRANPDQNFRKDLATKTTMGDWNCDGKTERVITSVNVTCSAACPSGREGLAADIPCGTFGEYITCQSALGGLGCQQSDSGVRQQECR